ncbi:head maturation protease, ClpP-related [Sphingobium sp. AP50]|uniref:head maturation protease, ClpP-related n=1 Tax=Sphingobium sp. AP50 TaxID=1884369 RepID=UPI001C432632|nr:head maturation protease, ClpP-related [Sphingobium sp. AP50]
MMMRNAPRLFASARPGALPLPADRRLQAFTPASVIDRYGDAAAGVRAVAKGDNIITMFDSIGEDYWTGGGVTAKKVQSQLRAIGDRDVEVHINSYGGDMFEGIAVYNVLREHPNNITVKVMGMAASAASIIAMAGDTIEIGAASFLMIHNCWVIAMGNRHDMAETAAWLEPFDGAMADVYAARSGAERDEIVKWMDAETYMSGSTAVDRGFANALLSADAITVDEDAQACDRSVNELRAMELALVASGMTRTQARAKIKNLKGTPGAATDQDVTPGADDRKLNEALTGLLANLTQ